MNTVIIGSGKVGFAVARMLDEEGYDITIIENRPEAMTRAVTHLDLTGVYGSGTDIAILKKAGVPKADLVIAATSSDETNLVCCFLARKLGAARTIARVRNPEYAQSRYLFKRELGLSMMINPEEDAAFEIVRMLPYSPKVHISSFSKGQMEIAEIILEKDSPLAGRSISWLDSHSKAMVQYSIIQRGREVIIPNGSTILQSGDKLTFIGRPGEIQRFFLEFYKERQRRVREVMIVGGSRIACYLTEQLLSMKLTVKLIEKIRKRLTNWLAATPT